MADKYILRYSCLDSTAILLLLILFVDDHNVQILEIIIALVIEFEFTCLHFHTQFLLLHRFWIRRIVGIFTDKYAIKIKKFDNMQKNLIMDEYIGSIEDSHLNASTSTDYDYCNDPFQSWTRIACISSITQFAVVDNLNH